MPVLVIASAVPTNSTAYLHDINPDITTGQTVGAGHFLQLEIPGQVNLMIERFPDGQLSFARAAVSSPREPISSLR